MYSLSISEDLSSLLGANLLQVCTGINEVILNFDKDIRLTVLSDFTVEYTKKKSIRYKEPIVGAVALLQLLHDSITLAQATTEGDLRVEFASGDAIIVHDTSKEYESFLIRMGKKEIVV